MTTSLPTPIVNLLEGNRGWSHICGTMGCWILEASDFWGCNGDSIKTGIWVIVWYWYWLVLVLVVGTWQWTYGSIGVWCNFTGYSKSLYVLLATIDGNAMWISWEYIPYHIVGFVPWPIKPGFWFGTVFIFPSIGNNDPKWLSYFSGG